MLVAPGHALVRVVPVEAAHARGKDRGVVAESGEEDGIVRKISWYRTTRDGRAFYWTKTLSRQSWLGSFLLWLALRIDGVKKWRP